MMRVASIHTVRLAKFPCADRLGQRPGSTCPCCYAYTTAVARRLPRNRLDAVSAGYPAGTPWADIGRADGLLSPS